MAAKKKSKTRKGSKVSSIKLSNKRNTKLAKQGKIRNTLAKNKFKSLRAKLDRVNEQKQSENKYREGIPKSNPAVENEETELQLDDEDYSFYENTDSSFVAGIVGSGTKRKKNVDEDTEANYEKKPRKAESLGPEMRPLLPIKGQQGIVPRSTLKEADEDDTDGTTVEPQQLPEPVETKPELLPVLSTAQMFAKRQQKLQEKKQRIAALASISIEDPAESGAKLRELRSMLEEKDSDICITVKKLAMISLLEVFKDIIPGYRIRALTETEKQQSMKEDTRKVREAEEALLNNYRMYLQFLEKTATCGKKGDKKKAKPNGQLLPKDVAKTLSLLAVRCMCELLVQHPHFNYRINIIKLLVPFMDHKNSEMSDMVCDAIKKIFRGDLSGDVSLEIVRLVSRMIKSRNFKVQPKVLQTFLSLKIKEVNYDKEEGKKKKTLNHKEKKKLLSRRERKRAKQMEALQKELQEADASEDKSKKIKVHTQIVEMVFLSYFRILKTAHGSKLLSAVLEGLAKFAHLINVEFFQDLFNVMTELIESDELSCRESLHCIQTAFTILSGQGAALNIDPLRFYKHLYNTLMYLYSEENCDDLPIALNCLDIMITKRRKQVSLQRVLAFIKRLSTLALLVKPHATLGILATIRNFIHAYPRADVLFDNESQGSGLYLPDLNDPEHCNAHNTAMWEIHLLTSHFHPVVCQYATHICRGAPSQGEGSLPQELGRKSAAELYEMYDNSNTKFHVKIPPPKKYKQKSSIWTEEVLQPELREVILRNLDNSKESNF